MFSTTRPFPAGDSLLLLPRLDPGNATNTFDLHARQTTFGAAFSVPEVLGFTPGGKVVALLLSDNLVSDQYGILPYNAYSELKNKSWRIAAGLQNDVFNPLNPRMNAFVNLALSGNAGSYRGQVRVEHFARPSDGLLLTSQVAISEPTSTVFQDNRRLLEDNGWPNVEGRLAAGLGAEWELAGGRKLRPVEFGVSGVVGQLRNANLIELPISRRHSSGRSSTYGGWGPTYRRR